MAPCFWREPVRSPLPCDRTGSLADTALAAVVAALLRRRLGHAATLMPSHGRCGACAAGLPERGGDAHPHLRMRSLAKFMSRARLVRDRHGSRHAGTAPPRHPGHACALAAESCLPPGVSGAAGRVGAPRRPDGGAVCFGGSQEHAGSLESPPLLPRCVANLTTPLSPPTPSRLHTLLASHPSFRLPRATPLAVALFSAQVTLKDAAPPPISVEAEAAIRQRSLQAELEAIAYRVAARKIARAVQRMPPKLRLRRLLAHTDAGAAAEQEVAVEAAVEVVVAIKINGGESRGTGNEATSTRSRIVGPPLYPTRIPLPLTSPRERARIARTDG